MHSPDNNENIKKNYGLAGVFGSIYKNKPLLTVSVAVSI
jgi:hypothetical protein